MSAPVTTHLVSPGDVYGEVMVHQHVENPALLAASIELLRGHEEYTKCSSLYLFEAGYAKTQRV